MAPASSPLFSVIIPTYNRKDFVCIALSSVLNQTYKNFELILIDDGSTDKTKEALSQYKDKRITYFYQQNHGVAHARNRGIECARGDFIAFLDSDDKWAEQKLQRTLDYIKKFPHISIFHTEETWIKGGKILNQKRKHKKPTGFVFKNALPLCCIGFSTAVVKRDVFNSVGLFDETFSACEDYDFWLRATHCYEVKLIPECLTIKDGGRADQLSQMIWGLDRFRIKALAKMLSSSPLGNDDYEATFEELRKKTDIYLKGAHKRAKTQEITFYKNLINRFSNHYKHRGIYAKA